MSLRPCPFCGSTEVHVLELGARCYLCGALGPIKTATGESSHMVPSRAIAAWNRRPVDHDALVDRLTEERDRAQQSDRVATGLIRDLMRSIRANRDQRDAALAELATIKEVDMAELRACNAEAERLRAALQKVLVGADTQGAFTGMSWTEAAAILRAALGERAL
jgi:hypothetical protein